MCPQARTLLRMKTPVAVTVLRPHRQTKRTAIQIMAPIRQTSGARGKSAYWSTSGKEESTSWKVRGQRKLGTKLSEPCATLERQELQSSARTKSAYKTAKTNNNKAGRPHQTSPYYDSFDEVLGTRAVVTMPGVLQSGKPSEESSSSGQMNDSNESDEESDDGSLPGESDSESSPSSAERRPKRNVKKTKEEQKKKAKKGRVTTASAMVDLTEKLVGMQNSQMEMMKKAQKRAEDLLVKLEADQRKLAEEGRRRDQEFFLRMMEIMKK